MNASVSFAREGEVATITLNEAQRLNPFTTAVQEGILDGLQRVREDEAIRALIITGAGRGFCVGADLPDFLRRAADPAGGSLGTQVGHMLRDNANRIVEEVKALPVPVICAVNGVAAGGGVGLALAGDLVLAARSAYFYLPFAPALGAVPDMGTSWALPRAVGRSRAIGLTLTGDKLDAARAEAWGLIWACVDDDQLQVRAKALAQQVAALPAHAILEVRALFEASAGNDLSAQLALEAERQSVLIDGDSFREGMQAFVERRPPVFQGRRSSD
jgi:2-(1,2-epoxy-1,2-dihydrophenyl)acetyl-CoA isomerase